MRKLTAKQTLKNLIDVLTESLQELNEEPPSETADYIQGEKTAYAECLEIVQKWKRAKRYGIDYDVEKEFCLTL